MKETMLGIIDDSRVGEWKDLVMKDCVQIAGLPSDVIFEGSWFDKLVLAIQHVPLLCLCFQVVHGSLQDKTRDPVLFLTGTSEDHQVSRVDQDIGTLQDCHDVW